MKATGRSNKELRERERERTRYRHSVDDSTERARHSAHYFYRIKYFAILLKETDDDDNFFFGVQCVLTCVWLGGLLAGRQKINIHFFFPHLLVFLGIFFLIFFSLKNSFFFLNQLIFRQYTEFERLVIDCGCTRKAFEAIYCRWNFRFVSFTNHLDGMIKAYIHYTVYTHRHSSCHWLRTAADCVRPYVNKGDMFSFMILLLLFFSHRFPMTHLNLWKISLLHIIYYGVARSIGQRQRASECVCWQMCAYAKCVKTTTHQYVVLKSHCTQF